MKVHVPHHITAEWVARDIGRTLPTPGKIVSRAKADYEKPRKISIRQFIARAAKVGRKV